MVFQNGQKTFQTGKMSLQKGNIERENGKIGMDFGHMEIICCYNRDVAGGEGLNCYTHSGWLLISCLHNRSQEMNSFTYSNKINIIGC